MPELAIEVWKLFEPYLHIEAFRKNLDEIFALESLVAGVRSFPTFDVSMEAHEFSLPPPRDSNSPPFIYGEPRAELRLFDLLLPDVIGALQPDARVMFPYGTRLDYHIRSSFSLYQQMLRPLVNNSEHNLLDVDKELAFQAHLLELIAFMLSAEHTPV